MRKSKKKKATNTLDVALGFFMVVICTIGLCLTMPGLFFAFGFIMGIGMLSDTS